MGCKLTKAVSSKKKIKRNGLLDQYSCTVSCQVSDPPERPILTRNQIAILTNTSKLLVENISRVGVITFMNLFEAHPDVQEVFMPFKGLYGNDLRYSRELRAHAFRVMGIVQKVITRLNEEEKLDQLLTDLGKKHARYGAKPKYIDLIGPQFVHAIKPSLEDHWTKEMEEAWCQLFRYIAWVMKAAMVEYQSEYEVSSVQSFR